jgi:hypothetical protein
MIVNIYLFIYITIGIGVTDLACEIKFVIDRHEISIDIVKSETETAKSYYQAIVSLSIAQWRNRSIRETAISMLSKIILNESSQLPAIAAFSKELSINYQPESYSHVFEEHFSNSR